MAIEPRLLLLSADEIHSIKPVQMIRGWSGSEDIGIGLVEFGFIGKISLRDVN